MNMSRLLTFEEVYDRMWAAYCAWVMFKHPWPSFAEMFDLNLDMAYDAIVKAYDAVKFHTAGGIYKYDMQ